MKSFILFLSVSLLFSCKQNQKSLLEGAWIRKGTINYKGGKPIDTVEFKGIFFEVYTKGSFSLLMNEIKIDSITGEDTDKGVAEAGTYTLNDNKLKKKVYYGTGWLGEGLGKWSGPDKDYIEMEFEVDYGNNHLSKLIISPFHPSALDSLGNGFAEYYTRVD
tara:strand:- start:25 stop:510 length:486 start_codon:yes stop_codon:yes gene_type:complete